MPYEIVKVEDGFKVCKKRGNKCFSKSGLDLETAKKQMKAIQINENKGGSKPTNPELYNKIKDEVYKKYPKHSLFRSAMIVKLYKNLNGKYEGEKPKMNINKWFKQNWISIPDFYYNDEIVPCGKSDTEAKFGVYPLCRPLAIVKSMTGDQIEKMIEEKNKLKEKHIKSADVLGTDKYNIKSSITGMGKNEFEKQLQGVGLTTNKYLEIVKIIAKKRGYNPELLSISNDGIHKLEYDGVKFGRVNYNDKIIYMWLEKNGKIPTGTTKEKYTNYRKRAEKVMKATNNKFSPASLSFNLIW